MSHIRSGDRRLTSTRPKPRGKGKTQAQDDIAACAMRAPVRQTPTFCPRSRELPLGDDERERTNHAIARAIARVIESAAKGCGSSRQVAGQRSDLCSRLVHRSGPAFGLVDRA